MSKKQNIIERTISWADTQQQRRKILAFPYAVMKKYDEDKGNYLAALLAFYGFLSLFPLLIVLTAVAQKVSLGNYDLQDKILESVTSYFPALGTSLAESIQTPSKAGLALVIGLIIALYGARGIADAVQHALNHIWGIPRDRRAGFPTSLVRSFGIIIGGGLGFIVAALVSGFATASGMPGWARFSLGFLSLGILYVVFWALFTYGSSARHNLRTNLDGALFATAGFQLLQLFGAYLINHQLKQQSGLNAQFAFILAILFWLYLQARVFIYAVQINSVRFYHLYPRSITTKPPIAGDINTYDFYQKREIFIKE